MSKETDDYRLGMLRKLREKASGKASAQVLDAEKVIAKHRDELDKTRAAIPRFEEPLPTANICPRCWGLDGVQNLLKATFHPDPDNFDRMKCTKCSYYEDRQQNA
jgi:hypothetical protein